MSRIDVTKDRETQGYKVLVNFCQRFVTFHSPALANKEAQQLHDTELPHAELHLFRPVATQ